MTTPNSDQPTEYFFGTEGCYITELSNTAADPEVSIAQARVAPGVTTAWHKLKDTTERYLITSGEGRVEVGNDAPRAVTIGDVVLIAPMERQRITNTGTVDLVFLAICSPRFDMDNYLSA
ncbi:cupin domain-containing protein [Simiduia aestuariiviva]|uniref:Mannose-6-phosphate isomerase-like protein (Cupin superfamily) n=1 Tax=Simiduia aestuariiviva TaxID=1510459 RepID=A0A839UIM6_9GAMM|nr:cupin domain-containing protein [Simiduia aestuariiviva]MBB3167383.1 mannose-6-phosphate isomerase-like protein (cupin superfamily) [Simiduia aestuariiviva]